MYPSKNRIIKFYLVFILLIGLIFNFSAPVLASDNTTLDEIRTLLKTQYVDPVSDDVLKAANVQDTLDKLSDPWTVYFTPEEYQGFMNSVNMQIVGIGVVFDSVPNGIKVVSVLPNSPAEEAGLQTGDIIISADGQVLSGKPAETSSQLIRGAEGTKVSLGILRGSNSFSVSITRRKIDLPSVSGELIGKSIGYIDISEFSLTTTNEFDTALKSLQAKGADRWIIDLRNDPGGYVDTALKLAGYFIGSQPALEVIDRSGTPQFANAVKQSFLIDQPVIFLTNENSASASEILTAALKDYQKATIIGTKTYGKGKMQQIFSLSEGGALKMTIARFYSPQGHTIDKSGVSPDIDMGNLDAKEAAVLLLDQQTSSNSADLSNTAGYVKIKGVGQDFQIPLKEAESKDEWPLFYQMVSSLGPDKVEIGSQNGWLPEQEAPDQPIWPIFYPGYTGGGNLFNVPLEKKFIVDFPTPINWSTVNNHSIQLVDRKSGQTIDLYFDPVTQNELQITPKKSLQANSTYWLVINPDIQDIKGVPLKSGEVVAAQTINP